MSAAAVQSPTHTVAGIEHCLALGNIPLDRFLTEAKIPRSTWTTWRAGRARPRPDRWASVTAAFDALVAEPSPAPAAVVPEAAGAEPVVLTGSSAPTGAPPTFVPIASTSAVEPSPPEAGRVGPAAALATLRSLIHDMDRLSLERVACEARTVWPPVPETLFKKAEDSFSLLPYLARYADGRHWYPPAAVEGLRALTFEGRFVDPGGRRRRRRDAIVGASEAWQCARAAASIVSGLNLADAACRACAEDIVALRDALLDAPASSLTDILAKAAVFAWWHHDAEGRASDALRAERAAQLAAGDGSLTFVLALAVLADLVAMGEARGMTVPAAGPASDAASTLQAVA